MTDHTPTPRTDTAWQDLLAVACDLKRELAHYKRLEAILESREDVRDGPDGEQLPNEAMSILTEWRGPV